MFSIDTQSLVSYLDERGIKVSKQLRDDSESSTTKLIKSVDEDIIKASYEWAKDAERKTFGGDK